MKIRPEEITKIIGHMRSMIPESIGDVKGLLSMTLEKSLTVPEGERLAEAVNAFRQAQKELNDEKARSTTGIDKQIDTLVKQIEAFRKNKTKIASRISEVISAAGDPANLYAEIYKVTTELHNAEDVIRTLEREKQYPDNPKIQALGSTLFDTYVITIQTLIEFNKAFEAAGKRINLIMDTVNAYIGTLNTLKSSAQALEREGIRSYAFVSRDVVPLPWGEFESIARAEIEKRLRGGVSK